jgi:hypothetical protein
LINFIIVCSSLNIIRVSMSRKILWPRFVAEVREMRNMYEILAKGWKKGDTLENHGIVMILMNPNVSIRPPLWSSGQSSWLQIRRHGFDFRHYQKKSSGSGTGSTQPHKYNWGATWWKSGGSCLENREYGRRDPSRWPRGTLYPQMLAITSPTSGGRSVGNVRSRTWTMEFSLMWVFKTVSLETALAIPTDARIACKIDCDHFLPLSLN